MKLPNVNFTQAQRLKSAGFDWWTSDFYYKPIVARPPPEGLSFGEVKIGKIDDPLCLWSGPPMVIEAYAPTVALALKWLRDVKGILSCVDYSEFRDDENSEYDISFDWSCGEIKSETFYATYEEAESALLDAALAEVLKGGAK